MERLGISRRPWALLAAVALATAPSASRAQGTPVEQLQKELESMRKQMQQMQKRLDAQDAVIRKLGKEPAAPPPVAEAPPPAPPAPPPPTVAKAPEIGLICVAIMPKGLSAAATLVQDAPLPTTA